MLETALDQEVPEPVHHKRISLTHYRFDYLVLLLSSANLELLLEKDRGLLVVSAYNLVDDVFPITRDIFVQETAIVQWLKW